MLGLCKDIEAVNNHAFFGCVDGTQGWYHIDPDHTHKLQIGCWFKVCSNGHVVLAGIEQDLDYYCGLKVLNCKSDGSLYIADFIDSKGEMCTFFSRTDVDLGGTYDLLVKRDGGRIKARELVRENSNYEPYFQGVQQTEKQKVKHYPSILAGMQKAKLIHVQPLRSGSLFQADVNNTDLSYKCNFDVKVDDIVIVPVGGGNVPCSAVVMSVETDPIYKEFDYKWAVCAITSEMDNCAKLLSLDGEAIDELYRVDQLAEQAEMLEQAEVDFQRTEESTEAYASWKEKFLSNNLVTDASTDTSEQ